MNLGIAAARRDLMQGSPMLPIVVAMLFIFALLLTFHYVVSDGKHQAELRHKASASRAVAMWRCHGEPARDVRNRCLAELSSAQPVSPPL
jgi:hypothetical protein